MIRKATSDDIESIEDTYNEHFKHETEHGAFTVFKKAYTQPERMPKKLLIMEHYMCMKKITVLPEV